MRIVGDFVTFLSLFMIISLEKFGYHLQPGCAHSACVQYNMWNIARGQPQPQHTTKWISLYLWSSLKYSYIILFEINVFCLEKIESEESGNRLDYFYTGSIPEFGVPT